MPDRKQHASERKVQKCPIIPARHTFKLLCISVISKMHKKYLFKFSICVLHYFPPLMLVFKSMTFMNRCGSKYLPEAWRKEYVLSQSHQSDRRAPSPNYWEPGNIKETNGIICSVEHRGLFSAGHQENERFNQSVGSFASSSIPQLDQRCLSRKMMIENCSVCRTIASIHFSLASHLPYVISFAQVWTRQTDEHRSGYTALLIAPNITNWWCAVRL